MVEEKKDKTLTLVKILAVLFVIIIIGILIIAKINIPTFPLWQVIVFSIVFIIMGLGLYFGFRYFSKPTIEKDKDVNEKLPPSISIEQAREMAIAAIKNPIYADYIANSCLGEKVFHLGKNVKSNIYMYKAKGVYEDCVYCILINMHKPLVFRTVLINPENDTEIYSAAMQLSEQPLEEKETRVIHNRNILTGQEQRIVEKVPEKTEEKVEENKEDI